jgi:tRNA (adenine57-N1/adenine58-N1)-methyltransferase catalytic subunit
VSKDGFFKAGDRIQLTDPKGKLYSFTITPGKEWHTHKGWITHDDLIGLPEGSVVSTTAGLKFTAFIPLLADYVLSMPRGATIVYPKDAAMIVGVADIYPGARVLEAGVGSGALTLSLLRAVGPTGFVHSVERRQDFADNATANLTNYFTGLPEKLAPRCWFSTRSIVHRKVRSSDTRYVGTVGMRRDGSRSVKTWRSIPCICCNNYSTLRYS